MCVQKSLVPLFYLTNSTPFPIIVGSLIDFKWLLVCIV